MKFIPENINKKQSGDTGMAAVLIFLLLGWFTNELVYFKLSIPILIITMTIPLAFKPLAYLWLGFSNLLGAIMSKVILSIAFITIVTPMGVFRKMIGKDALQLKSFKKGRNSVLITRNHKVTAADMEQPY